VTDDGDNDFRHFLQEAEPRLRRALVAAYGGERGREATAEALAYAWEHWERVGTMSNATGYLYRVGQSRTRARLKRPLFVRPEHPEPWFEPSLAPALEKLSERQRTAVVLVHGFGWTLREVAECTDVKVTSVQNHLDRGMQKLRAALKVGSDA
jgi:DNA-directed RNA polymerase specialized sigma24 family protein